MKTKTNLVKQLIIVLSFALVGTLVFTGCKKDKSTNNTPYTISGNASGSQMVPMVSGTGTGTLTGTYDPSTGILTYTSNWTGLTGGPTSGGFYTGTSGTAGTALGTPWTLGTGLSGTGSFSGTTTLTSDQANQLTSGNMYYTLGTATNMGGEVRGQITATR